MSEQWIDVSAHQGVIDWPKVAVAGIKGTIIRAGYGNDLRQTDKQFYANMKGAIAAGLKVAVYWFGYPDSVFDAQAEFATCKKVIEPYRSKALFVCYDYEYDSVTYYRRIHGSAPENVLINSMVNAFFAAARADGWKTALYLNNDYRKNVFTATTMKAPDYLWLADYTGGPDISCTMQQTGSTGRVNGISGNVDMDTAFVVIGAAAADPPYTCDTSGDEKNPVVIARGAAYQALITCKGRPRVGPGTADVVTVLHRYDDGDKHYYYFVPIGQPGQEAGIYINGGPRQFVVKVK